MSEVVFETDPAFIGQLVGPNDSHLRELESQFSDLDILLRGSVWTVQGEDQRSNQLRRVVDQLEKLIARGDSVSSRDVIEISQLTDDTVEGFSGSYISAGEKRIRAKTAGQVKYLKAIDDHTVVFGLGPAGTGKTYLAMAKAVEALQNKKCSRIILTRPAVEAGERLGYLPGTLSEKIDPYLRPLFDALQEMLPADSLARFLESGVVEVAPLAYMRGRTFKNSFIIADEMQNATPNQMKMLLTRLGEGSNMTVTGDLNQADRLKDNGLIDFVNHLGSSSATRISTVFFGKGDIERHEAVKEVLEIYGDD